jgi:hypothetical protein
LDSVDAHTYFVEERGVHPQVVIDSMVGVVPADLNVAELYAPLCQAAEKKLADVLALPRKPGRPTKKEQEAISIAEYNVKRLKERADKVAELQKHKGKVALFYTDAVNRIVRARVQPLEGGESIELHFGGSAGGFGHALFAPGTRGRSLEVDHGRTLVAQSEFDVLQLQSLAARLAELEGLPPEGGYLTAVGVSEGAIDAHLVRSLGQMPLVISNGSGAAGARMIAALRQELNLLVARVPESKTLDDLLRLQPDEAKGREVLLDLASTRTLVTRPFEAVQSEIDKWRSMEEREVKKFEADRWATHTLARDISQRGQLFYDGRTAYVFDKESKHLLPVERDNAEMKAFLAQYGVAPSDAFVKHALSAIELTAQETGHETTAHSLSHFDVTTNRLYLFDQDRWVYRISPTTVERVANGTDGVLFVRNPKWEPFEIGEVSAESTNVADALLGSVRLREQALSRSEQEWLFESWLYAMFFPELFPTRPILAMIGEKGSGKTSVLRRIGRLLFGSKFQVMGMTHEPRDFDAAVTGDAFVGIDNADANVPWLDDKLAVVATGGMLKRRKYYTTNQLIEYPITAFVAVTSRTPYFRREDVADRLLLFHVERLEAFGAESGLLGELTAHRNQLMTTLVGELQRVLAALEKSRDKAYHTTFRIADFAEFVLKVADADDKLHEAEAMFERLAQEQLAFTVQDDPVVELLEDWLKDYTGQELTTGQLFIALQTLARYSHRSFDFKSAVSFGQYLQSNRASLKALFGADERTGGGRKRLWRFAPSPDVPVKVVGRGTGESKDDDDWGPMYMEWVERTRRIDESGS